MNGKQIAVVGLVVVLMGLLLSLNIKGLVKDEQHAGEAATEATQTVAVVDLQSVSKAGKVSLNANLAQQITELERQLTTADDSEKAEIQKQLAERWSDVNQPAASAFYYEMLAQPANNFDYWLKAGDLFSQAYQDTKDTLSQPGLVQKAMETYKKALAVNPESLDAKTGLGVAYVNGSPNPMEGVTLLREVVAQEPKNLKANMSLGLLSMKSGQFDKAIDRFKTVIEVKESPDAWFYLASAYENLRDKENAIIAYEKSKELAADPALSTYVDRKVQELKK